MRRIALPILCVMCVVLYSCKDNVICPAFQSTYILDDIQRAQRYSYFANDSTPKMAVASRRNKYGINKSSTLFRKNYDMKTAPKVNVLVAPVEDTVVVLDEGVFLVSDFSTDSLASDSLATGTLLAQVEEEEVKYKWGYDPKDQFNSDQDYYNKYYGDLFIDNRPTATEIAKELEEHLQEVAVDSTDTGEKKKKFGFNRKKDAKQAEPEVEDPIIEESTPEDSFGEEETQPTPEPVPEETPEEDN